MIPNKPKTRLIQYKKKVKYKTINNVGDIVFDSDHTNGTFTYKSGKQTITKNVPTPWTGAWAAESALLWLWHVFDECFTLSTPRPQKCETVIKNKRPGHLKGAKVCNSHQNHAAKGSQGCECVALSSKTAPPIYPTGPHWRGFWDHLGTLYLYPTRTGPPWEDSFVRYVYHDRRETRYKGLGRRRTEGRY